MYYAWARFHCREMRHCGSYILAHAQTCLRSIFSTLLARGTSDAACGYQHCSYLLLVTVGRCLSKFFARQLMRRRVAMEPSSSSSSSCCIIGGGLLIVGACFRPNSRHRSVSERVRTQAYGPRTHARSMAALRQFACVVYAAAASTTDPRNHRPA